MNKFVLAACLFFATPCFAEDAPTPVQSAEQRVSAIIGGLVLENAKLMTRVEELSRQLIEANRKAAEQNKPK